MGFDVEASQKAWREAWEMDPPVGRLGTRVLVENNTVRVWHLELQPGETSPLHTHMNPYLFVVLEAAPCRTRFADGTSVDDDDRGGKTVWVGLRDNTRTHTLTNIGSARYTNRVIELLSADRE